MYRNGEIREIGQLHVWYWVWISSSRILASNGVCRDIWRWGFLAEAMVAAVATAAIPSSSPPTNLLDTLIIHFLLSRNIHENHGKQTPTANDEKTHSLTHIRIIHIHAYRLYRYTPISILHAVSVYFLAFISWLYVCMVWCGMLTQSWRVRFIFVAKFWYEISEIPIHK